MNQKAVTVVVESVVDAVALTERVRFEGFKSGHDIVGTYVGSIIGGSLVGSLPDGTTDLDIARCLTALGTWGGAL